MEEQNNTQQEQPQAEQQEAPQAKQEPVIQADAADAEKNKGMAIVAYFIFFLPLLTDAKDSPFAKFHANQSLMLLIGWVILSVIGMVPILGWIVFFFGAIAFFIFWIMGIINAANGEMKELPIIGSYHLLDK